MRKSLRKSTGNLIDYMKESMKSFCGGREKMTTEDLFWLAVNAYHEARGEGHEGMVAVCHVVLNRVAGKKRSVKEVILQPLQFSWANGGARPPIKDYSAFQRCMEAAKTAEKEQLQGDTLLGADHYHATDMPQYPSWAKGMKQVARIGGHVFYRSR